MINQLDMSESASKVIMKVIKFVYAIKLLS